MPTSNQVAGRVENYTISRLGHENELSFWFWGMSRFGLARNIFNYCFSKKLLGASLFKESNVILIRFEPRDTLVSGGTPTAHPSIFFSSHDDQKRRHLIQIIYFNDFLASSRAYWEQINFVFALEVVSCFDSYAKCSYRMVGVH